MPNIRQFDTPALGLRPTETGVETVAGNARRIGMFYNQQAGATEEVGSFEAGLTRQAGAAIGSSIRDAGAVYDDVETHREIGHGGATFAQLQDNLTTQWNDAAKNADPNDPSVAAKFRETVLEPELEKFTGSFSTDRSQQWAEQHAEALRTYFFHKTAADMSTLAGVAVSNNIKQSATSMTNTAFNDPSSVPFLLESADHTIGGIVGSSPNLKGADAAKARETISQETKAAIVKSGFQGAVKSAADPEAEAQKWIDKYPQYINGAEANQFAKAAKVQAKANLLTEKQLQLYGHQQAERAAEGEASKIIADNMSADENGRLTIKPEAIQQSIELARKYGDAGGGMARTMINFFEAQQNKELKPVDNPNVVRELQDRMFDPEQPLTIRDLMKARTDGSITDHTYSQLNGMLKELENTPLKGPVYQSTLASVKDQLILRVPGIPGQDDVGIANYAKFMQTFWPQYMAKYRAGTLEPNALDVKDPDSMISKAMAPFKRSPQQRMQDFVRGAGGLGSDGAPAVDGHQVPPSLRGIASLQYNPTKNLWRDQTTGTIYNAQGDVVSK